MKIYVESNAMGVDHIIIQQVVVDISAQSAIIYVLSEDSSNAEVFSPKHLLLSGADYAAWSDDNPYIKNWVLAALGYTEREEEGVPDGY